MWACVCTHICTVCVCVCTVHMYVQYVCVCARMYSMSVCTYVLQICTVHVYVRMYSMYVCMYCIYVDYVYICMYSMYECIYVHSRHFKLYKMADQGVGKQHNKMADQGVGNNMTEATTNKRVYLRCSREHGSGQPWTAMNTGIPIDYRIIPDNLNCGNLITVRLNPGSMLNSTRIASLSSPVTPGSSNTG